MPKLKINLNIADAQRDNVHGMAPKTGFIFHETVSPQVPNSMADLKSVSDFLDNKDYGIHGIADNDGLLAWAYGLARAIFYHTDSTGAKGSGHANTNKIGIECISRVMLDYKSRAARIKAWLHMDKEINTVAKLVACAARANNMGLKSLKNNDGDTRQWGTTTHWEVTQFFGVRGGHVDAWPVKKGGYFPKGLILTLARRYYLAGWSFQKP